MLDNPSTLKRATSHHSASCRCSHPVCLAGYAIGSVFVLQYDVTVMTVLSWSYTSADL